MNQTATPLTPASTLPDMNMMLASVQIESNEPGAKSSGPFEIVDLTEQKIANQRRRALTGWAKAHPQATHVEQAAFEATLDVNFEKSLVSRRAAQRESSRRFLLNHYMDRFSQESGVQFVHLRCLKEKVYGEEDGLGAGTYFVRKPMPGVWAKYLLRSSIKSAELDVSPFGGATVAYIPASLQDRSEIICIYGAAVCNPEDSFDSLVGRGMALFRLLKAMQKSVSPELKEAVMGAGELANLSNIFTEQGVDHFVTKRLPALSETLYDEILAPYRENMAAHHDDYLGTMKMFDQIAEGVTAQDIELAEAAEAAATESLGG